MNKDLVQVVHISFNVLADIHKSIAMMQLAIQHYSVISLYSCINLYCDAGRPVFFLILHCVAIHTHIVRVLLQCMFCLAIICVAMYKFLKVLLNVVFFDRNHLRPHSLSMYSLMHSCGYVQILDSGLTGLYCVVLLCDFGGGLAM